MPLVFGFIATVYLSIALYTDIRWMIIPNRLVLIAAVVGIMFQTIVNQWSGLLSSIVGLFIVFLVTLVLYLIKAVGAGDVKAFAALAAITGTQFTIYVLITALIYAGLVGLLIMLFQGKVGQLIRHWLVSVICYWTTRDKLHLRMIATYRVNVFPFMIAVMPAFVTCLLTI